MEVILIEDIQNLGHKGDVLKVKDGYARNFLLPKKYAILATESNKKVVTENQKQRAFKENKIKIEAEKLAEKLKNITVIIGAKVGTSGKIFGSVNAIQIAEAIHKQFGHDIDRKKIFVDGENIKEVGNYTANIKLHKEVNIVMNFEVIAE
jgi:large subunit ribosomal protein L9